ncbi:hypothetical protein QAD02_001313 [Eretmocerus hayati]|uniref:Uncharacterized protein n=1 Tax=Eretmocerus hayati TaxID=131215 RepID=A0ACC2NIA2_9HYME|nr:hypothetical protein QAD02_001313 [Eretmocerus hayati]
MKCILLVVISTLALSARAQVPGLGGCPEYLPMANFDMGRFAGIWYEAERYFQLNEVGTRCVRSNYTKTADGKYRVVNEVLSRVTGIKRVLEGELKEPPSKSEEGKLHVKYTTVPLIPLESQYTVLDTDYKNYAVLWNCQGIGLAHAASAWIMTRERLPAGEIIQKAYGTLDKHKISRYFFVKSNQDDCVFLDTIQPNHAKKPSTQTEVADSEDEEQQADEPQRPKPLSGKSSVPVIADSSDVDVSPVKKVDVVPKVKSGQVTKHASVKQPVAHEHVAEHTKEKVEIAPELLKKAATHPKIPTAVKAAIAEEAIAVKPGDLKHVAPIIAEEQQQVIPVNSPVVEKVEGEVEIVKP